MPMPRFAARLNRIGPNHLTRRLAPRLPGLGVVIHHGRRSGREYHTPVNVFHTSGGIRIALTYGAGSDWVKNVLAAGGCRLHTGGRYLDLAVPRLARDPHRNGIPPARRALLRLLRVSEFLDLREPAGHDQPTTHGGGEPRQGLR